MKNKSQKLGLAFLCLSGVLLFVPGVIVSAGDLIVSEIMYDPEGTDSGHTDWIEIFNPTDETVIIPKSMFGLIDEPELELGKDGIHHLNCHGINSDVIVGPSEFVILADKATDFHNDYPDIGKVVLDSTFSLSSNGDTLRISRDKCATFWVDFEYEKSWGGSNNGRTLEKKVLDAEYLSEAWQESFVPGGTPGEENSKKPEPKKYSSELRLNEVVPNPDGDESKNEYIEIFNGSDTQVDLEGWVIRDSSANGKYVFPGGAFVGAEGYLVVFREDFKFALNNSGTEKVFFHDPNGKLVSEVVFDGAREELSFGFDGKKWRWSRFRTPGGENMFDDSPDFEVKRDKNIFKSFAANFDIKIKNYKKDKTKITWDFGDGHKSYKKTTTHKYEKKGKYEASVKIFNGSEEVKKEFTVEVKNFPKYDVDIVSFMPNPEGKDAEFETVTVRNDTSKKIDLNGWSVATGGKKLVNHPIRQKLILGPKKELVITRDISKFSLNNKKGKIELRYPNGKVADKVKYDKGEAGAKEGEVFEKTEDGWRWRMTAVEPVSDISFSAEEQVLGVNTEKESAAQDFPEPILADHYKIFISRYLFDRDSLKPEGYFLRSIRKGELDFLKLIITDASMILYSTEHKAHNIENSIGVRH